MKLKNITFEQWIRNHSLSHDDKWCRELYPFNVFSEIEFDNDQNEKKQLISL